MSSCAHIPKQIDHGRVEFVDGDDLPPLIEAGRLQFVIDARVIIPSVKTLDDLFSVDGFDDIGGAIGILRLLRAEEFADNAL